MRGKKKGGHRPRPDGEGAAIFERGGQENDPPGGGEGKGPGKGTDANHFGRSAESVD